MADPMRMLEKDDDDDDDNLYEVEYVNVGCNDTFFEFKENMDEDSTEIITETTTNNQKNSSIKEEPETTEVYHCNACDLDFHNVRQHVNKFHKNQSVLVDEEDYENILVIDNESSEDEYHFEEDKSTDSFDETSSLNLINNEIIQEVQSKKSHNEVNKKLLSGRIAKRNQIVKTEGKKDKFSPPRSMYVRNYSANKTENQLDLKNKIVNCHIELKAENVYNIVEDLEEDIMEASEESKTCEICNTQFASIKSLKLHGRMHNPVELRSYKKALGFEYKKHFKNVEHFRCGICKKRFDKKLEEVHKKFHQNDIQINEFVCHTCNKKFMNETSFAMHQKLHENQSDKPKKQTKAEAAGITLPYACQYCGRGFGRPHEKVKHERIHTGEKPFKCEVCGKCFRVSYSLTLHLRTHTGARPYVCAVCNKRFKSYSVYSHHLLTHSEDRPYKCPHCPKSFKTSVQLHGHRNSHTKPFNCPDCNRPFATMYAVKAHMETHKKGKVNLKQRCNLCGATYARIFALKDHMREAHNMIDDNVIQISETDNDFLENYIYISNEDQDGDDLARIINEQEITIEGEIIDPKTEEVVSTNWFK